MKRTAFALFICIGILLQGFAQISEFPYTESFDNGIFPESWSQQYVSGSALWAVSYGGFSGYPSMPYSGSGNAIFSSLSYDGDETFMISPELNLSGLSNPRLRFWHAQYNWDTDQDELRVYYKHGESGEWIWLASYTSAVTAWTSRTIELPAPTDSYYIGFKAKSGYGYGVVIDQIVVDDAPVCNAPSNFHVLSTSTESVTLGWNSTAGLWQIEYGTAGFEQGSGLLIDNVTQNPHTIFGLQEGAEYDVYLKAVCQGISSNWVGPLSFSAACNDIITTNYLEGFESSNAPPACWSVVYQNTSPPAGNLVSHTTTYAFSGNRSFRFSSYSPGPPYGQYLISPKLATYTGAREFRFWYKRFSSGSEIFRVGYSTTGNNLTTDFTWTNEISDATAQWKLYTMDMPLNVKYVAINYRTVFQYYLYVDQLQIRIPPVCPQPENLQVTNISATSAHFNWSAGGTESQWQVEYGPSGFYLGSGTSVNTQFPVYIASNLTANTSYDVYIRALCSEENSEWVGPVSFTTPYGCAPITSISVSAITAETAYIDWNPSGSETLWNIEYGISGFVPGTGTLVNNIPQSEYLITALSPNTLYEFRIQADCSSPYGTSLWSAMQSFYTLPCDNGCNYQLITTDAWGDGWGETYLQIIQNGVTTQQIYMQSGSSQSQSIYLCNGATVSLVIHPSSFVSEVGLTLNDPFGNMIFQLLPYTLEEGMSSTELLSITASCVEPDCLPPFNVVVSGVSAQTADIQWNHAVGESVFQISYGLLGTPPEDGTLVENVVELNFQLNNLSPAQSYDVYIGTSCGSTQSIWSGPVSFTTTSFNLLNPVPCNAGIQIPDNNCISLSIAVSNPVNQTLGMDILVDEIRLVIAHTFDADLDVFLIAPDGTSVMLFTDVGGSGDNFGLVDGSCLSYTALSMTGGSGPIGNGTAPFIGSYVPEGNLNDFHNGGTINGNWTLLLCDDSPAFMGTLEYFEIVFVEQKYMEWSTLSFVESPANNGSIGNSINITVFNDSFAALGALTEGTHFVASNIPAGLSVGIEAVSENSAVISLLGNALLHSNEYDVSDISIEFLDAAFIGNNAQEIIQYGQQNITIDFKNLTDVANISPDNSEYICFDAMQNYFVEYLIVNSGENIIPQGTVIPLLVTDFNGITLLNESITLTQALGLGEDISGISQGSLSFENFGENWIKIIVKVPSDIIAVNDTVEKCIIGVDQQIVFWNAENDSLAVSEYPAIVASWMEFYPDYALDYSFYWQNGISTSNSIDVIGDGWYRCTITTEACAVTDSVYVYLVSSVSTQSHETEIVVYPNPVSAEVYIEIAGALHIEYAELFSFDGRLIYSRNNAGLCTGNCMLFDLSSLPDGIYMLRMYANNRWYISKIVKRT